jgi:hypothetical protein
MEKLIWTDKRPKYAEYYWALYKDKDSWLDFSPEIVKVYFDGHWRVFRPGDNESYYISEFLYWAGPIYRPEILPEEYRNIEV